MTFLLRNCWVLSLLVCTGNSFVLKPTMTPTSPRSVIGRPLHASYDPYDDSSYDDALARNKARTDLRNLLTQRSIQSFVYLLKQCHDEHTVHWIEKALDFKKLDRYHGTGAFLEGFPSWDSLFVDLVARRAETVVVEVQRRRKRHRGLSGQNSYLENLGKAEPKEEKERENPYLEDITVEFEFDIDPASLVTRMISVREQISKEWKADLDTLINCNDDILVSYTDKQKEMRASEDEEEVTDLTSPYSDRSQEQVLVFDRNAMVMLANSIASQGRGSSPLRQSNFDLLLLLSTQESIHRVLREYAEEDSHAEDFEWLKEFYSERVGKHFDGHQQSHGRADDFLEELLLSPPVIQKTKGDNIHLIDPMGMAEDIIRERSEVARGWKGIVDDTAEEHIDLQRLLLTRRMMEVAEKTLDESIIEAIQSLPEVGVFE